MKKFYRYIIGYICQTYSEDGKFLEEMFCTTDDPDEWEDENFEFIDEPDFKPVPPFSQELK